MSKGSSAYGKGAKCSIERVRQDPGWSVMFSFTLGINPSNVYFLVVVNPLGCRGHWNDMSIVI